MKEEAISDFPSPGGHGGACGLEMSTALDLGAEIDEQGLERATARGARRPDRALEGAGAALKRQTASDLGHAGRSNPTSAAHGTACPSDRGVGGRGGHCLTFAFYSLLSSGRGQDKRETRAGRGDMSTRDQGRECSPVEIRVRPSSIRTRPFAISRTASGRRRRSSACTRAARLSGVSSSRTATVSCKRIGPSS